MKTATFNKKTLYSILGVLLLLAGIEVVAIIKDNSMVFPHLKEILASFVSIFRGNNICAILMLLKRVAICVSISLAICFFMVLLYKVDKDSVNILRPLLSVCKSTPIIILTLLVWLLVDSTTGLYVVCVASILPIMADGVLSSLENIPSKYISIYKMERTNIWSELALVELPLIAPNVLLAIVQTLGMAIKVSVVTEYVYQLAGSIGKSLKFAYDYTNMADLLGIGLLLAIIEICIEIVITRLKKKLENNTKE